MRQCTVGLLSSGSPRSSSTSFLVIPTRIASNPSAVSPEERTLVARTQEVARQARKRTRDTKYVPRSRPRREVFSISVATAGPAFGREGVAWIWGAWGRLICPIGWPDSPECAVSRPAREQDERERYFRGTCQPLDKGWKQTSCKVAGTHLAVEGSGISGLPVPIPRNSAGTSSGHRTLPDFRRRGFRDQIDRRMRKAVRGTSGRRQRCEGALGVPTEEDGSPTKESLRSHSIRAVVGECDLISGDSPSFSTRTSLHSVDISHSLAPTVQPHGLRRPRSRPPSRRASVRTKHSGVTGCAGRRREERRRGEMRICGRTESPWRKQVQPTRSRWRTIFELVRWGSWQAQTSKTYG